VRSSGPLTSRSSAPPPAVERRVDSERIRRPVGSNDPTFVGRVDEVVQATRDTADEWDASPTQDLTGEDLPFAQIPSRSADGGYRGAPRAPPNMSPPRPRAAGGPPPGWAPPATVAGTSLSPLGGPVSSSRAPAAEPHDPGIVTSQAVRVVVWRDAGGVHVAP